MVGKSETTSLREVEAHVPGRSGRERALADAYYQDGDRRVVHDKQYDHSPRRRQRRLATATPSGNGLEPMTGRIGVYPGSFDPPTRAHLEIAITARETHGLARVDLAISAVALGKAARAATPLERRLEVVRESIDGIEGLGLVVTHAQLVADIADGYDVVVMGADKWAQVNDPAWYGHDHDARDEAVARLPELALAPRPPHPIPARHRLPVADDLLEISSTAARAGRVEWMTDPARRSGHW